MIKFIFVSILIVLDIVMCFYWGLISLLFWKNCFPTDVDGAKTPFILSDSLNREL